MGSFLRPKTRKTSAAVFMILTFSVLFSGTALAGYGDWTLYGDGYSRQRTIVDNRTVDMGPLVTSITHRVRVWDTKSDALGACTTVYVDKSGDGEGWKNAKTVCDPDGYGGSGGVMWYTANVATAWQTCDLKIVMKAGGYTTTKYTSC